MNLPSHKSSAPVVAPDGFRLVEASRLTRSISQTFRLLTIAILAIGGYLALQDLSQERALADHGRTAQIQRLYNPAPTLDHSSTYVYFVGNEKYEFERRNPLRGPEFDYPSSVTYLPEDPATHRLGVVDKVEVLQMGLIWFIATFGLAFIAEAFRRMVGRFAQDQIDLLKNGHVVSARVTAVGPTEGGTRQVSYEYEDIAGETQKCDVEMNVRDAKRLKLDTPTIALISPDNEEVELLPMLRLATFHSEPTSETQTAGD